MKFIKRKIKIVRCELREQGHFPVYIFHIEIRRRLFGILNLPPLLGTCKVNTYPIRQSQSFGLPIIEGNYTIDREVEAAVRDAYYRWVCLWSSVEVVRCEIESDND